MRVVTFFGVLFLPLLGLANDNSMVSWLANYRNPTLGNSFAVENITITRGHLVLELVQGSVIEVNAGSKPVGFFFQGEGIFTYKSQDLADYAVFRANTSQATGFRVKGSPGNAMLNGKFKEILLLMPSNEIPEFTRSGGPPSAFDFAQHRERFAKDWSGTFGHLLYKKMVDQTDARVFRAEWQSKGDPFVYELNEIEEQTESLYTFFQLDVKTGGLASRRYQAMLSKQAAGRERGELPRPPFQVTDITYTLITEGEKMDLELTETLVPLSTSQRTFLFSLQSDFFENRHNRRPLTVKSITDSQGREMAFDHVKNRLLVTLPEKAEPDQPIQLNFKIEGKILLRVEGDNYWELVAFPWFPKPTIAGQSYSIHSTVKVKAPYVPIAPGKTLKRTKKDGYNIAVNQLETASRFAGVFGGKYYPTEEKRDNLTVRVFAYGFKKPKASKRLAKLAFGFVEFYSSFLGPYPLDEINIVEARNIAYFDQPPGLIYLPKRAFGKLRNDDEFREAKSPVERTLAGIIAQAYWDQKLQLGSWEDRWIGVAFGTYCSALAFEHIPNAQDFDVVVNQWKTTAKSSSRFASLAGTYQILEKDLFNSRRRQNAVFYYKGPLVVAKIHKELGDRMFFTMMRAYLDNLSGKYTSTEQLLDLINFLTKKDYRTFFEKYIWGVEIPK